MNHAVADGVNLGHGGNHTVFRTGQLVDDGCDRFGMRGHGKIFIKHGLSANQGAVLQVTADPDALAKTLCENGFGFHVDQLIFQGRAASIDNKNFHELRSFLSGENPGIIT